MTVDDVIKVCDPLITVTGRMIGVLDSVNGDAGWSPARIHGTSLFVDLGMKPTAECRFKMNERNTQSVMIMAGKR